MEFDQHKYFNIQLLKCWMYLFKIVPNNLNNFDIWLYAQSLASYQAIHTAILTKNSFPSAICSISSLNASWYTHACDYVQARKLCEKHSGYLADIQSDGELLELNRVLNLDQKKHFFPYWILKYGTSDYHGGWCSNSQSDSSQCSFLKV